MFNFTNFFSLSISELVSPTPSSLADLSSPDTHDLQVLTRYRYPRGIINPNYPGFQHLAHTLAEHFIDHHNHRHHHHHHSSEQQLSDSELSDEADFDVVAYRSGNLANVNIMSDSNNNSNAGEGVVERAIDLNRNKNRQCASFSMLTMPERVASDFDMKADDGNVNLLMKSEPKVFCESKQLEHLVIAVEASDEFSSEDEDEECCNLSHVAHEPQQMEFDDDDEDMADLSGEDDAAIKNELERIDSADNDFNENINCDLVTYLQQYDFKMDLQKSYQLDDDDDEEEKVEDGCLTDEDNCKLPTPDILIEHNGGASNTSLMSNNESNKKLQNDDMTDVISDPREGSICDAETKQFTTADVSQDEVRDFQPDLIKSIGDNNHERITGIQRDDNDILPHAEREILNDDVDEVESDFENEEKIINQVQTDTTTAVASGMTQLSFDSATSAVVDIIGDFGKEIEKEIGLIVSGYLNGDKSASLSTPSSPQTNDTSVKHKEQPVSSDKLEVIFDENKFIEHLKYFSKVS